MWTPKEYLEKFSSCALTTEPSRVLEIKMACKIMVNNQLTYWGVEKTTGIPWLIVAILHYRESSQNFKCHLHNGDPLSARTVHVPVGRPTEGEAPFTWTASAVDALSDRLQPFEWTIASVLEFCERYNGMGYQHHGINSPYIWGCTDQYKSGLFIADGTIDTTRKDPRPGAVALLRTLAQLGVALEFKNDVAPNAVIH